MDTMVHDINELLQGKGYDFKWISGSDVVVANWVRMKCMYGCADYGIKSTCPPNVPSIDECREFFNEYHRVAVIRFGFELEDRDGYEEWIIGKHTELMELEREVFLAGYHKTFLLPMGTCRLCQECGLPRADCIHKAESRPTPEAFGVDLFGTVHNCGFPIQVLTDYTEAQNRYSLLMVE